MKTRDLQNALTDVDDKYITEAATYRNKTTKAVKVWRAVAIAACCLIAIPVAVFAGLMISNATGMGHMKSSSAQAVYDAETYAETTAAAYWGSSDYYSAGATAEEGYGIKEEAAFEEDAEWEYATTAPAAAAGGMADNTASSDAKIIRTADIDIQSTEYDNSFNVINALVQQYGGYFESRSIQDGSGYRNSNLQIRIPAENYDSFIEALKEAGTITALYESADDVSESYRDIESRLETARTKLARLQELLAQAEDMSDIIAIEEAISNTEWDIDYLQGALNGYDSRVSYSTIFIYLREVYKVENNDAPITFSERMSRAFSKSLESFGDTCGDIAIWFAESWIWLLIVAAVIAAGIIIPISCVRAARKKRK